MAIKKNITTEIRFTADVELENGNTIVKDVTIENAYIRVNTLWGNKSEVSFTVGHYQITQDNTLELVFIKEHKFMPNLEDGSENFIKQAYEYLKTLTEYAGALDC